MTWFGHSQGGSWSEKQGPAEVPKNDSFFGPSKQSAKHFCVL